MPDAPAPAAPAGLNPKRAKDALSAGDAAIVLWLWFARCSFIGAAFSWWPDALILAGVAALGARWLGLHRPPAEAGWAGLVGRGAVLALGLAAFLVLGGNFPVSPVSLRAALWFGGAAGALLLAFRAGFWAAQAARPDSRGEALRWLALGAGATLLLLPFYGRGSMGAGDAYWYVITLADFTTQLRHGVFPVWIGQSPFAFNGAVSPLRLAPWYQYVGGLVDLATAHRLEPTALKNAVLCLNAGAIVASAYACLRAVAPRAPGIACALALLWLASPGVFTPFCCGDQYLQFMAMPFLPPLLLGCWRLCTRDDGAGRRLIAVSLAGLLLSHTPMALWGSLLAGAVYLVQLLLRRRWLAECGRLAWMGAIFLVLGAFAVGSALTIDHPVSLKIVNPGVAAEVARAFPANFEPIDPRHIGQQSCQIGYTLLAAGLLGWILLAWLRPRGAALFPAAALFLAPFTLPVPWLTAWIWARAPNMVVAINNVWPMPRLFAVLALLMAFALAAAAADPGIGDRRWRRRALLGLLLLGGVWSASEASKLLGVVRHTLVDEADTEVYLRPENLRITRYAYSSFDIVPPYVSHGYMEPDLENRLLDRRSLAVMTANADAAAPRVRPDSEPATLPRLAQSGEWTATSDNHSDFYLLGPPLRLEPDRHYALRLDFAHPDYEGILQIISDRDDVFREYMLPDSGAGLERRELSRAFGSLPTSGRVLPLRHTAPEALAPTLRFVMRRFVGEQFDFGRFWLFTYDPAELPVRVLSWVPYEAETATAVPAYLETPRIWQSGWRALVNGRSAPVLRSPHNLAMVPIGPGSSRVTLTFHAPLWLATWFWACLAGWIVLAARAAARVVRRAGRAITVAPAAGRGAARPGSLP